jgi:hypothetical protein
VARHCEDTHAGTCDPLPIIKRGEQNDDEPESEPAPMESAMANDAERKVKELVAQLRTSRSPSWASAKLAAELAIQMMEIRNQETWGSRVAAELAAQMIEMQNQKKREAFELFGGLWIAPPANHPN